MKLKTDVIAAENSALITGINNTNIYIYIYIYIYCIYIYILV